MRRSLSPQHEGGVSPSRSLDRHLGSVRPALTRCPGRPSRLVLSPSRAKTPRRPALKKPSPSGQKDPVGVSAELRRGPYRAVQCRAVAQPCPPPGVLQGAAAEPPGPGVLHRGDQREHGADSPARRIQDIPQRGVPGGNGPRAPFPAAGVPAGLLGPGAGGALREERFQIPKPLWSRKVPSPSFGIDIQNRRTDQKSRKAL